MLSGDRVKTAEAIGQTLGMDRVYAELLPQDKLKKMEEILQTEGKGKTAFVGDGINDAPVLAGADVGIAMGAIGSDAAIEAADVVLMDDDIQDCRWYADCEKYKNHCFAKYYICPWSESVGAVVERSGTGNNVDGSICGCRGSGLGNPKRNAEKISEKR